MKKRISTFQVGSWKEIKEMVLTPSMENEKIEIIVELENEKVNYYTVVPDYALRYGDSRPDIASYGDKVSIYLREDYLFPIHAYNVLSELINLQEYVGYLEKMYIRLTIKKDRSNWQGKAETRFINMDKRTGVKRLGEILSIVDPPPSFKGVEEIVYEKIDSDRYSFTLDVEFYRMSSDKKKILTNRIEMLVADMDYYNRFELGYRPLNSANQFLSAGELYTLFFLHTDTTTIEQLQNIQTNQLENEEYRSRGVFQGLELLPRQENHEIQQNIALEDQLKNALRAAKIVQPKTHINITSIQSGTLFDVVDMVIPNKMILTQFTEKKAIKNLQGSLGSEGITVRQGEEPGTVSFQIPVKDRKAVFLTSLLDIATVEDYFKNNPLPFLYGVDIYGQPMMDCLTKLRHMLVSGSTGSGKTVFMNQMITSMLMSKSADDLNMYLIDPKYTELEQFSDYPQVRSVITDMRRVTDLLESLIKEANERQQTFKEAGCKTLAGYRELGFKMPYVVVIVDEFADLVQTISGVEDLVQRIAQKARSAGMHLVIATQRPSVDVISGVIKANLPSKVAFKLTTQKDYETALGESLQGQLLGRGHGSMISPDRAGQTQFQGCVISLNEKEEIDSIKEIASKMGGTSNKTEFKVVEEETLVDRIKTIIANTGEAKVGELSKQLQVRKQDVSTAMQELVEEGWLEKGESSRQGYKIIASQEVLNIWKK